MTRLFYVYNIFPVYIVAWISRVLYAVASYPAVIMYLGDIALQMTSFRYSCAAAATTVILYYFLVEYYILLSFTMLKRARLTLMADVHNNNKNASYTAGSGVGASSISVRRAKLQKSAPPVASLCQLQPLPGNSRVNNVFMKM